MGLKLPGRVVGQPVDIAWHRGAVVVFLLCEDFISVSFKYVVDLLDRFMYKTQLRPVGIANWLRIANESK
jgi:hypothetical protein